ncbi:hypothetical protein LIER_17393 [Lithospermum erythrorhizon]|uniref:Uncharacterized protein n=1 Tax=Lithospermum erythrorhizon TaxID=34254 RepID=A0AAV3QCP0_LITER
MMNWKLSTKTLLKKDLEHKLLWIILVTMTYIGHDDEVIDNDLIESEIVDNQPTLSSSSTPTTTRTSTRTKLPSTKYPPHEYVLLMNGGEPTCFQEILGRVDKQE